MKLKSTHRRHCELVDLYEISCFSYDDVYVPMVKITIPFSPPIVTYTMRLITVFVLTLPHVEQNKLTLLDGHLRLPPVLVVFSPKFSTMFFVQLFVYCLFVFLFIFLSLCYPCYQVYFTYLFICAFGIFPLSF